ncbi:MAG: hypothetical protein CMF98_05060 [Candidatus Marinimicrobia bacterium]|nr:hypothetical protein [Candidatus Neomarinimicrobiota bacterium]OUW50206.1 MAG: hypothetical protein CBD50_03655 [bacterium TMED190]
MKLNFKYFIIFINLLLNGFLFSQNNLIDEIQISGNKNTKDKIILREIYQEKNSFLDSSVVKSDIQRLLNLGIFTDVRFEVKTIQDRLILNYHVIEHSLKIIPGFTPIYSEEKGWSYAFFAEIMNFRGLNQSLDAGMIIGEMNTIGISFKDPWIIGNHISFAFDIMLDEWNHTFLPYYLYRDYYGISFGKWWDYKLKLSLDLAFRKEKFSSKDLNFSTDEFKIFNIKPTFSYDKRDVYRNPTTGFLIFSIFDYNHIYNKDTYRLIVTNSFSKYFNFKNFTFGFNTSFSTLFGYDDQKMIKYFGGLNSIRGWKVPSSMNFKDSNDQYRFGNHNLIFSSEIRKDLIKYSSLNIMDLNFEKGLTSLIFYDIGFNSQELESLLISNNLPLIGFGFGLRVPFLGNVIGPDFGWSYYNKNFISSAIHIRVGHKF